jgi:hypothetical protein
MSFIYPIVGNFHRVAYIAIQWDVIAVVLQLLLLKSRFACCLFGINIKTSIVDLQVTNRQFILAYILPINAKYNHLPFRGLACMAAAVVF